MIFHRIGDLSISKFSRRIEQLGLGKFPEFSQYGKMTFFLPIDAAFDVSILNEYLSHNSKTNYWHIQNLRVELIDEDVVRAHIVPDELLFSLPPKRRPELYPTIQYNYTRGISNLEVKAKVNMKNRGNSYGIIRAS